MSLILSGTDGLSDIDGTAATPAIRGTDANTGIFFGTDIIGFSEGGVEAMRLNASGNLQTIGTISVGNATPSTSGAGITFPATQSASSDANTLDDYEEGTWTPVLSGGAGSITTQTGTGTYQKIGNMVYTTGVILVSNVGTVSGSGTVSGLPFTNSVQFSGCGSESAVTGKSLNIRKPTTGATSYDMNYYDNSGTCNGITNGNNFIFNVYYQTSQ